MPDIFFIISLVCFCGAGICLLLAVFFWFHFKIPTVIGDLSGRNARRSIAEMRDGAASARVNSYYHSPADAKRGKTGSFGKKSPTGKIRPADDDTKTNPLGGDKTNPLDADKTQLLDADKTELLDTGKTQLLEPEFSPVRPETGLLNEPTGAACKVEETTTLSMRPPEAAAVPTPQNAAYKRMIQLERVILIHTNERIN